MKFVLSVIDSDPCKETAFAIVQRYEELKERKVVIPRDLANIITKHLPVEGFSRLLKLILEDVDRKNFFS